MTVEPPDGPEVHPCRNEDSVANDGVPLSAVLADADDGSEEAMRRLAELKKDPSVGRTWDEIKGDLGR